MQTRPSASTLTEPLRQATRAAFRVAEDMAVRGTPDFMGMMQPFAGVGELELAPTPNEVIYKKDKVCVRAYRPAQQRYETPILFVYSLINRYYILDFLPGRSLIAYLLEQGFPVYAIDWGTPGREEQELTWADYVHRYLARCVKATLKDSGAPDLTLYGYCMGGTLALAYASLHPEGLRNFVAQAVPVNFHDEGILSRWTRPEHFDADAMVDAHGNVPIALMEAAFRNMDPIGNVQKWDTFVRKFDDKAFLKLFLSMEAWAGDNIPFPGEAYREYIRGCYQTNDFMHGRMRVGERRVDLGAIEVPLLNIIAKRDHIAPPSSSEVLPELVGSSDTTTLRFNCGYIALSSSSKAPLQFWPSISEWLAEHSVTAG